MDGGNGKWLDDRRAWLVIGVIVGVASVFRLASRIADHLSEMRPLASRRMSRLWGSMSSFPPQNL
jgi:hypothetical protein